MKVNIKKSLPCIITSAFYTIWHIAYLFVITQSVKIIRAAAITQTLEQAIEESRYWNTLGRRMVHFTSGFHNSDKWRFLILVFLAVIIFYGVRYAIVTYLSANIFATVAVLTIKYIYGADKRVMLGPADYIVNLIESMIYTSRALLIAIILSLPLVLYRQYRKYRKQ